MSPCPFTVHTRIVYMKNEPLWSAHSCEFRRGKLSTELCMVIDSHVFRLLPHSRELRSSVITQWVVVISYILGHSLGPIFKGQESGRPHMKFISGRVWVVISSSSMVPASRDNASGWKRGGIWLSVAALNRDVPSGKKFEHATYVF